MPAFVATIIECFTRHEQRAVGLTCKVLDFDANWIVVLEVTSADGDSPIQPGRANILIHSPAQTFHHPADEIPTRVYRFELSRQPHGWWLDRASRVDEEGTA